MRDWRELKGEVMVGDGWRCGCGMSSCEKAVRIKVGDM